MSTPLAEVLGETPAEEPVDQPVVEPEVTEAPETPEEPQPEVETKAEAKVEEKSERMVPLEALIEERTRRKMLEERVQQQPAKEPEPAPDVFDDPKGYQDYVDRQVSQRLENERLNMSEEMARLHYGDDVVESAIEAAKSMSPAAVTAIRQARNPYRELIKTYQAEQARAEIGDPKKWKAEIKAQIRAELESELAVKQVRKAPSLAADPNIGARTTGPAWSGPSPLTDLIGE